MSRKNENKKGTNGAGSIRKITTTRNGKEYTYWQGPWRTQRAHHRHHRKRSGDPHRPRLVQNLMKTGLCDYAQPVFSCPF